MRISPKPKRPALSRTHARRLEGRDGGREGREARRAETGERNAQCHTMEKKQDAKGHALRTPQGRRRERKSGDLAAHARAGNKNEAGCLITHGANSNGDGGTIKSKEAQQTAPRQNAPGRPGTHVARAIRRTGGLSASIELETACHAHPAIRRISVGRGRCDFCAKLPQATARPRRQRAAFVDHAAALRQREDPPRTTCANAAFH